MILSFMDAWRARKQRLSDDEAEYQEYCQRVRDEDQLAREVLGETAEQQAVERLLDGAPPLPEDYEYLVGFNGHTLIPE